MLGGRSNENVVECLEDVLASLDSITILSTRKIIRLCVAEAITQIKSSDFIGAGVVLNLIHNLPRDESSLQRWDIDYFLSIELSTFLDRFEDIRSARLIALYVCNQLACQYLPIDS